MEITKFFEDVEGLSAILQLTGPAAEAAQQVFDELANSTGKLDMAFQGATETSQFMADQAMARVKTAFIQLGDALLPIVIPAMKKVADMIKKAADAFQNMSPMLQKVILLFGGLARSQER